jgi:hypothetical protein
MMAQDVFVVLGADRPTGVVGQPMTDKDVTTAGANEDLGRAKRAGLALRCDAAGIEAKSVGRAAWPNDRHFDAPVPRTTRFDEVLGVEKVLGVERNSVSSAARSSNFVRPSTT